MTSNGPVLGTTLYSFTNEWQRRAYTLEQLVEKIAKSGLGPAVEAVGFQSFRTYPDISDEFAKHFRNLLERNGLFPSCLGANLDFGRRRDRLMTDEEKIIYIQRQIDSAVKLGFPVMRIQTSAGTDILGKILPLLERAKLHLGFELHSPLSTDNPEVIEFREVFDKFQSAALGFIPDFSTTMTSIPEVNWENMRDAGAEEALIDAAKAIWITNNPIPAKFKALAEAGATFNVSPELMGKMNTNMTMFGHMPVDGWKEILLYVRHIHGKFYHVNEEGIEPSIPYPALMALLKNSGYSGTISAEWEGHAYTTDPIGFQEVEAWRKMCNRLLGE